MTPSSPRASDKVVFLVGAGFSVEKGLPLMDAFLDRARRNYFDAKKDSVFAAFYQQMLKFKEECVGSGWAFNTDWDNIEQLYTQADLRRLAGIPNEKEAELLCQAIAWSIWDVYRSCSHPRFDAGMLNNNLQIQLMCDEINKAHLKPVFVTTNYDLVLENNLFLQTPFDQPHPSTVSPPFRNPSPAASRHWQYYYPGFELGLDGEVWHSIESPQDEAHKDTSIEDRVPIIKLHGSVNWFASNKDPNNKWVALTRLTASKSDVSSVDNLS